MKSPTTSPWNNVQHCTRSAARLVFPAVLWSGTLRAEQSNFTPQYEVSYLNFLACNALSCHVILHCTTRLCTCIHHVFPWNASCCNVVSSEKLTKERAISRLPRIINSGIRNSRRNFRALIRKINKQTNKLNAYAFASCRNTPPRTSPDRYSLHSTENLQSLCSLEVSLVDVIVWSMTVHVVVMDHGSGRHGPSNRIKY